MKGLVIALLLAAAYGMSSETEDGFGGPLRVYVGTYTQGESKGIYLLEFDPETGAVTNRGLAAESINPAFLAVAPDGRHLYAVNELVELEEEQSGGVSAFGINQPDGSLRFINQKLSRGTGPCYISLDRAGKYALVANYGDGTLAVLPIDHAGALEEASSVVRHEGTGPNAARQEGPHAHSIDMDPTGRFVVAADLGIDKVLIYRLDPDSGKLEPNDPPHGSVAPGAGPRHVAMTPDARFAYVVNELDMTVAAFSFDAETGRLTRLQAVSTIPGETQDGFSTAEILMHPSGRFVYASNRGHNSIAAFGIDTDTGRLTPVDYEPTGGKNPRNFVIDPSGRYLLAANQNSNSVVVFAIDQETGALTPTGKSVSVPRPVCLKFAPVFALD